MNIVRTQQNIYNPHRTGYTIFSSLGKYLFDQIHVIRGDLHWQLRDTVGTECEIFPVFSGQRNFKDTIGNGLAVTNSDYL